MCRPQEKGLGFKGQSWGQALIELACGQREDLGPVLARSRSGRRINRFGVRTKFQAGSFRTGKDRK